MKLLSILICSLESRAACREQLLAALELQDSPQIEVLLEVDNGEISIGAKRQRLLSRATGRYVCFIDDDDRVAPDYCASILHALRESPDCVGFNLEYTVDGQPRGYAIHSIRFTEYGQRKLTRRQTEYHRTPNHLNPVRRELALEVGFIDAMRGEDTDYAQRLRPHLKSEVFIDRTLYHYQYRSKK